MNRIFFTHWYIIVVLFLCGCTINVSQPNPAGNPQQQSETETSSSANNKIPVTWGKLNLSGKLVFINSSAETNNFIMTLEVLDLVTGDLVTIFKAPANSYIYYVTVSPDHKQLIMSYSPPLADNPNIDQALYIMPLDGSAAPQLLFAPPAKEDQLIQAEWSPDGKYIYFTHVNYQIPNVKGQLNPVYDIYRMTFPNGQPEQVAAKAYWPRLSADSSRLVYVFVDPLSYTNQIYVADADGGNAHQVTVTGNWRPDIKDAPIFSPDGQSIIFSAPSPMQSTRPSWIEKLMGISIAKADGTIPSDWWSVPMSGGDITRLTKIQTLGLFASISPDNKHIASFSQENIFVMNPDGSGLTMLIPNAQGLPGTISWIP